MNYVVLSSLSFYSHHHLLTAIPPSYLISLLIIKIQVPVVWLVLQNPQEVWEEEKEEESERASLRQRSH